MAPCAAALARCPIPSTVNRQSPIMSTPPDVAEPIFCAIYRWRLHPGTEESFVHAWSRVTQLLRSERGSLGSRLHRGPNDIWYSYTQWPSAEAKAAGLAQPSVDPEAWQQLRDAIAESLPEILLEPVVDHLAPVP
jgi:heme-degrading monooxygenase HmoA